jgi:hypothetical protein
VVSLSKKCGFFFTHTTTKGATKNMLPEFSLKVSETKKILLVKYKRIVSYLFNIFSANAYSSFNKKGCLSKT